ncbi:MAG: hypothetical protein EOP04_19675 [Proteobacteria bacterium]|nr:MAG: hypothetical protein EOP04_19675 [Pseudomonadota bacterium]
MFRSVIAMSQWILGALVAITFLTGCNFKDEKEETESVTVDPNTPVTFAEIQTQILQTQCINCHADASGNQGGVNLETYAVVKSKASSIKSSTIDSSRMPQGSALSANQRALLGAWIAQGSPE